MTRVEEQHIPVSVLHRRLERHLDEMRRELAATPRWRWMRRQRLAGICGAYAFEIEELLRITGSWQPIWSTKPKPFESPTEIRAR